MPLNDRDRWTLTEIARQIRADDPELAAALTGPRPDHVWAPIWLRVLGFLLIAVGLLTSLTLLILVAFVVLGIAQLPGMSNPLPGPRWPAGSTSRPSDSW